ncbi:hypothetical protein [Devosia ginsengisoli]|uniref:Response regulatory domain-containing protein n=1 Tax=Devosia ginsengisoli TaxID=400770 RepID=A0A5B8LU38_9HYPH|nr:hypothetical protein [Devosia ginsengisoli]QDZ11204.1 hypothetical protein FPZ08_10795 [Devosia ginsengisoli]
MLNGRTALIVEEEFLIALDVQRMLETLGVGQTLFARMPAEAEQLRARWPEIAIAIIEARMGDPLAMQLAKDLAAARIPIVLVTGDLDVQHSFADRPDLPVVIKPVPEGALADAVRQALAVHS